jgi:hypothetical protein
MGYKGPHVPQACRRRALLDLAKNRWGVLIPGPLESILLGNHGGDALDAVLAAVSAYHHAARLSAEQHDCVRARADLLEGYIYARASSERALTC